jgi:hypothetical protein
MVRRGISRFRPHLDSRRVDWQLLNHCGRQSILIPFRRHLVESRCADVARIKHIVSHREIKHNLSFATIYA